MFPRSARKQPEDGSTPEDSSSSSYSNHYIPTIPANKGYKRYTLNEVFQVWDDNKNEILNTPFDTPVSQNENYKLSKPALIHHLELQENVPRSETLKQQPADNHVSSSTVQDGRLSHSLNQLSFHDGHTHPADITGPTTAVNGPPPGFALPKDKPHQSQLLSPDRIEWFYIDPLGNEQGPFNGDLMQEWLTGGYLDLELLIRRKEELTFKPLKELCESVQNYVQPFKVPLPDLTVAPKPELQSIHGGQFGLFGQSPLQHIQQQQHQQQQHQQQQQHHQQPQQHQQQFPFLSNGQVNLGAANMRLNTSLNSQTNLFGGDFIGADPFGTALPLAPLATSNLGSNQFGIDPINHNLAFSNSYGHLNSMPSLLQQQLQNQNPQPALSRTNSGWGALDKTSSLLGSSAPVTPSAVNPVLSSQISQPTPISPWIAGMQSQSRVSSPFMPSSTLSASAENSDGAHHDEQHNDHVLDGIHTSVVDILNDGEDEHFKEVHVEAPVADYFPEQVSVQQPVQTRASPIPEPVQREPTPPAPEPVAQPVVEVVVPIPESVKEEAPVVEKQAVQQKLAPWAAQQEVLQPALTLKEIQALEAQKLEEKQKQLRLEAAVAAKTWAATEEKQEKPALPKTSSWVTTNKPAAAQKTLAEIQKEEAEAAAAKIRAAKAAAIAAANASASASISTGPSAAVPSPALKTSSFASALANSIPREDSAWTTVAAKKPVAKKAPTLITNTSSGVKASPQLLRAVSATRPAVAGVNTIALKEEFLMWARSAMTNLYPSVSKDDLLDIFITLPATSGDSLLLIAETIYSSSATMDGRRFAQEFLKRRQKVDQQVGRSDDISWSSAIISSADKTSTVDEDGWSTSVKTKKKGKRN